MPRKVMLVSTKDDMAIYVTGNEVRRYNKRRQWDLMNKLKSQGEENPFLATIKPDHENYGEPGESAEELRSRLDNLEFGNFPGYYYFRNYAAAASTSSGAGPSFGPAESALNDSDVSETSALEPGLDDPRLTLMREEWFKGKSVLDIGCNRGHITYAIAKTFSPRFILGIDIDLKLIQMANRGLHLHLESDLLPWNLEFRIKSAREQVDGDADSRVSSAQKDLLKEYAEDEGHHTLSSYIDQGPLAEALANVPDQSGCDEAEASSSDEAEQAGSEHQASSSGYQASSSSERQPSQASVFPKNLLFVEHNYVLSSDELVSKQKPSFDTIICLSVTKWVHLNYRDAGLKRFFKRIYNHLNEGGLLILEAQPFDNYHRKKLSDPLRYNFHTINFKPEQFDEFLLSEQVGFQRILFSTTTSHECAGFKRPLKVFQK